MANRLGWTVSFNEEKMREFAVFACEGRDSAVDEHAHTNKKLKKT
jgi:hypothetical protein